MYIINNELTNPTIETIPENNNFRYVFLLKINNKTDVSINKNMV